MSNTELKNGRLRASGEASKSGPLCSRDAMFVEMLRGYRSSGGLAREDEIAARVLPNDRPAAEGDQLPWCAIHFAWGPARWWPRFQFNPIDMSLRQAPAMVVAELSSAMDGWAMAVWFVRPNVWIGNARPVDLIDARLDDVIGAARAAQFTGAS